MSALHVAKAGYGKTMSRVREDHGENTAAGTSQGVCDIVVLGNDWLRDRHVEVLIGTA